ncbi:MAG: cupin domain-containing protein [Syntrophotalea acetylenica]|uniref:Cupin n=1 Tax=Syntrophotalea acetylenica TaxID=29542 RepID=A0A1L3GCU4_SYNAC|nr:cupin domain-containing protein [Syntrophotalea acetylenica]APG23763.1 cupin [Syntrophotalea acetylenica]APG44344.1 cupin [Syntrophotalea acetylenica]MDD4457592.1 cupin domain-containing protein [Syntrophotalea acetylenica]MDY0261517.1 cupin domain-containing protein [Syntrophotalea acetylenica]
MKIVDVKTAALVENPHRVKVSKLHDSEHAQVMHITLEPGESLKKHITPVDVVFYVLEGRGVVEIGDEKQEVGRDTLIDSPAKIPHCWYNQGTSVLRILVAKIPRPTESTRLL